MRLSSRYFSRALALCIVTAAACGGSGDGTPSSPSEALDDAIQAQCQDLFNCQSSYDPTMHDSETFAQFANGSSEADCVTNIEALFGSAESQLEASVSAGRITFDAGDVQPCITMEEAFTCDQILGQNGMSTPDVPVCDDVFVGTVPEGGTCTTDNDCAGSDDECGSDGNGPTCVPLSDAIRAKVRI